MSPSLRSNKSEYNSNVTIYTSNSNAQASTSSSGGKRSRARSMVEEDNYEKEEEIESKVLKVKKVIKKNIINEVAIKSEGDDIKPKSPRKPKPFINTLAKAHPTPPRWLEAYTTIQEQRKRIIAPVDLMGCEQGGRERGEAAPNETDNRLSTLVSLMLSSQTKDPVTHQATMNLRTMLKGGLTVDSLLDSTPEEINTCINKVGFHNIKTANLAKLARTLKDEHNGEVPEDLTALLALSGVGPKMALLFLQSIGQNIGIGVDVHVHRITNRLGWHKPASKTPEQTRLNLESWLPKEYWKEINIMLVGLGQEICRPVGPRCDQCDLAKISRLCPSKETISPKKIAARSPDKKKIKLDLDQLLDSKPELEVEMDVKAESGSSVKVEAGAKVEPVAGNLIW